jgi:D-beta-D-heptose 7-phosphate kinase/D-beta-D-heptose 1-phosphate adenosyltransferase
VNPPDRKILEREELLALLARPRGERIVFTNGCFDVLHRGHVEYLAYARSLADRLVVAVNSDDSVRRLKGPTRPLNSVEDRAIVLAALESVDYVTVFEEDTPLELISRLLPDVLVKGADYAVDAVVGGREVVDAGGEVVLAPLVPGRSTTELIRRSREAGSA